jgi:hypothetical protein
MTFELAWMPAHAPYMPVATVGLLALLDEGGHAATAHWADGPRGRPLLHIATDLDLDAVAELIATAPWPREEAIEWPGPEGKRRGAQALKPLLKTTADPLSAYRCMIASAPPLEVALLRAIATDAALDADGIPMRSRLLRGVKGDLASVFKRPRGITGERLATELRHGPDFRPGESGLGLGLVPEVQTFGGTTGPDASTVGAYSALLYLLLWRGLIALPPLPVVRGLRHTVGGPLVTAPDVISWPRWRFPLPLRGLRILFMLAAIHADKPDHRFLRARGIDAVYRARTEELNSMIAVYRWGEQLAA